MAGVEENAAWISKICVPLLVVFFLLVRLRIREAKAKKTKLPPSPPKLPIIGNFHQLGEHPHSSLRDLSKEHGPLMMLHLGQYPTLMVSSAEMAEEILKNHDLNFASRPHLLSAAKLLNGLKDVIFSPYGAHWRQAKKICVTEMLSSKRVQSFGSVREEAVANMIRMISNSKGSATNLNEVFVSLTNDIVCKVALGRKIGGEYGKRSFSELIRELNTLFGSFNFGDFFPSMGWIDVLTGLDWKMKKPFREWDGLLDQVIKEHQDPSRDEVESKDFVDVLLRVQKHSTLDKPFTLDVIKAIVLDMISIGSNTSSATLEWVMAELVKSPEVMKKAHEEVRGIVGGKSKVDKSDDQGDSKVASIFTVVSKGVN